MPPTLPPPRAALPRRAQAAFAAPVLGICALTAACALDREMFVSEPPTEPLPARVEQVRVEALADGWQQVELPGFASVHEPQKEELWCWAACAHMVLAYDGSATTQEAVVERVKGYEEGGALKVEAASRYEVYRALAPEVKAAGFDALWSHIEKELQQAAQGAIDKIASEGKDASVELKPTWNLSTALQEALDRTVPPTKPPLEQLRRGDPALAGLRNVGEGAEGGHVFVVIGAEWKPPHAAFGGLRKLVEVETKRLTAQGVRISKVLGLSDENVRQILLVDPMEKDDPETPENEAASWMPVEEFAERVVFVTTREHAKDVLTRWTRAVTLETR